ncbi:MAG: exopolysaccharide biosynthesis protein, partial [Chlamydiota bacterium]
MIQTSSFINSLKRILKRPGEVTIQEILSILSEHGHPALLLIFTLPLCFPLQIPGMSTPFGLLLSLIGIQMGFRKRLWLPKWILRKKTPRKMLQKVIKKTISISIFLRKFLRP